MFIRFDSVTRTFAGATVPAVAGLSLEVDRGAFVVLLGPSGCGKSTTLRMLAGLEHPDAGRILIDGRDVTDLPPERRGVAMVFQNYALFPHLSVRDNILFGLQVRRVPKPDQRARLEEAVALLGLDALLARKPSQLSGGQQQRVALGRAVVARHRVLLMDEPLSNLDAMLRQEMRHELRALQRKLELTVLFVTHDQAEAMSMADRVVLMHEGRVVQAASPEILYARPASAFAARFVGTPPMNLLPLLRDGDRSVIAGTTATAPRAPRDATSLGIRPEAIRIGEGEVSTVVETLDYLGADTLALCRVGEARVAVRLAGAGGPAPGSRVTLGWAPADSHFFDTGGRRIDPPVAVPSSRSGVNR